MASDWGQVSGLHIYKDQRCATRRYTGVGFALLRLEWKRKEGLDIFSVGESTRPTRYETLF